jgi:putative transcriptional regulator
MLGDPNFDRSVVLLGHHNEDGALGWVLNGRALSPVAEIVISVLKLEGEPSALPATAAFSRLARSGGPVQPESGWILLPRSGLPLEGAFFEVGAELVVSSDVRLLRALAVGQRTEDFRLFLGYAGWGAGQLEAEIGVGAWLPCPLDADLVLDANVNELWEKGYRTVTGLGVAAFLSTQRGSA